MSATDVLKAKRMETQGDQIEPGEIDEPETRTIPLNEDEMKMVAQMEKPCFKVYGTLEDTNFKIESMEPMMEEMNASGNPTNPQDQYVKTHTQLMPS